MGGDEWGLAKAILDDTQREPAEHARALITLSIVGIQRPSLIDQSIVSLCETLLRTEGVSAELYDHICSLLAVVVYGRPELAAVLDTSALEAALVGPPLPMATYQHLGEVLGLLLAVSPNASVFDRVLMLLARPTLAPTLYDVLVGSLARAAFWTVERLDLAALVSLAGLEHLATQRERLLHEVIERVLFADVSALTLPVFEQLGQLYEGHPSFKYCLAYLAIRPNVVADVRAAAGVAIAGRFPLREKVARQLGVGRVRVLAVQNIQDKQGDEIIRVVPLLDALLWFNPHLEVVLVTAREYLYTHSRIQLVSFENRAALQLLFQERFEVVINFYEPAVREANYDLELEQTLQAWLQRHPPLLYLESAKNANDFVYKRVELDSRAYAAELGLDRQRIANVYETTFRLMAELGLPLRLGEEHAPLDSVLAGLPFPDADAAWTELLTQNAECRPVALFCPFGGVEPLKGYIPRQADALVERLRDLVAEGFYVVLLPNGLAWGSADHAHQVVERMAPAERAHVMIAPDPADWSERTTYTHFGTHTVPRASYQMRLVTYYVRFADLTVTVEGWMAHAAYCLGKRYRVLMLPHSHGSEWHPYGRTLHQDVAPSLLHTARVAVAEEAAAPPLPEQPRKFALLLILRNLEAAGDERAAPVLRWALESEDRDVRLAAAQSLGRLTDPNSVTTLRSLLDDPAYRVRAAAAQALLASEAAASHDLDGIPREHALAHQLIGQEPRDWGQVIGLGEKARLSLQVAMRDEDPVIRREAAWVTQFLDQHRERLLAREARKHRNNLKQRLVGWMRAVRGETVALRARLRSRVRQSPQRERPAPTRPTVLILTPVKDAADCLDGYCKRLYRLTYPHNLVSLGFLESDSTDTTLQDLERSLPALRAEFRRVEFWKQDFGYHIPPGRPRWAPEIQLQRRRILAKSRNYLLFRALDDETWVLWLDVDVVEYPPDLIERLLATGKEIVQPHCVLDYGGRTFDLNGWRDHGRLHLDDLRDEGELVELDAVGGTVLLVRADLHREGLVYPTFLYGRSNPRIRSGRRPEIEGEIEGEIETEGLGILAHDMGYRCWGMPHFEVLHRRK